MSTELPQSSPLVPDANLTVDSVPQKKSSLPLVILSLLVLVLVWSGGFILAKYLYTPKSEVPVSSQPPVATLTPTQSPFSTSASTSSASTQTDETNNWKTYVNSKVGFQFKVPNRYSRFRLPTAAFEPDTYATGDEDNTVIITNNVNYDAGNKNSPYEPIYLVIFPFEGSLEELVGLEKLPVTDGLSVRTLIKELKVGGQSGRWYVARPEKPFYEDTDVTMKVYFQGKRHGFIFFFENLKEDEIDQTISTFKFL